MIVRLQTEAKLHVQEKIRGGVIDLVWSAVMDMENSSNPDFNRKGAVADWQHLAVVDLPVNEAIEEVAEMLSNIGVKPMDALHVACAIEAHAEYFLTTDNALLRKMAKHCKIRVVDPVDFVRELKDENDEN